MCKINKELIILPRIDVDALQHAVISNNEEEINNLLSPFSSWEQNILSGISFLKNGPDLKDRLLGMQILASFFRNQGDLITATALASKVFQVLETRLETEESLSEDLILMAGNNLDVFVSGITEIGKAKEIVKEADRWSKLFQKLNKPYFVGRVKLKQVEALILGGYYEEAKKNLDNIDKVELNLTDDLIFEKKRLQRKIPDLLRAVDEIERKQPKFEDIVTQEVFPILQKLHGKKNKDTSVTVPVLPPEGVNINETVAIMGQLFGYITVKNIDDLNIAIDLLFESRNPNGALMGIIQGVTNILQNEQMGYDKNILKRVVDFLEKSSLYARKLEFWEYMIQSKWLRSISLKRMGVYHDAANSLRELREEIDLRRLSIKDPRLRAALIVYLPHLYEVNTEVLYNLGNDFNEELFQVIEGAKSKILGDLIRSQHTNSNANFPPDLTNFLEFEKTILSNLKSMLSRSQTPAHYLTFLVGNELTYAILVDNKGTLHSKCIEITRTSINDTVSQLIALNTGIGADCPARKGKIDPKNQWDRPYNPIIKKLSPLVEWLSELIDKSIIQKDHVICYSPDGPLFNIPLQMLQVNDEPLISLLGLTCVPSAEVLLQCEQLKQKNVMKEHVCAVIVPFSKDDQQDYDKEIQWIESQKISTTRLFGSNADYDTIRENLSAGIIVHFATHGHFDENDPLKLSGLSVGHDRNLQIGDGDKREKYLITPNKMLKLNLLGSHVTLRACVSGRVSEITAREVLGMLWAIFQTGAVSASVAVWSPTLKSASTLLLYFYQNLFDQKKPRWQAHQLAMKRLMNTNYTYSHPYHWSPFLLYGYWE